MTLHSVLRTPKRVVALLGLSTLMITASFGTSPPGASATTYTAFCNNQTLSNYHYCLGSYRTLYAVWGWGDNHSVCVRTDVAGEAVCSAGPGDGAFKSYEISFNAQPMIIDNAEGSNLVHGVSYSE